MAIASKVTTVVVTVIAVALIWLYVGQDTGRLIDFLKDNWSTVALAEAQSRVQNRLFA